MRSMYAADSEPGLDVIVVNYRTPQDLEAFVRSYRAYPPTVPSKLWIVDVDPPKEQVVGNLRLVEGGDFYISHDQNIGYARAVNDAAQRGHHDVLAIFNADVELTKGALDKCYEALMTHPDWAVVGPLQTDGHGRVTHAGIFGTLAHPRHRGWHQPVDPAWRDVRTAVSVSGSAYFIARDLWMMLNDCPIFAEMYPEAEGAFLPTSHYYEETWCSYHAQAHGFQVVYFGEVEITHHWHRASAVGGWAEGQMPYSQAMFRQMCDEHGIEHD